MKPILLTWITTLLISLAGTHAQSGCTDPMASNFDPQAQQNDGSCTYPPTSYQPALMSVLDPQVSELSGLVWHDGLLWGINDSGNEPVLYAIDTLAGSIVGQADVAAVTNEDWEALTRSDTHLFVADVGNNNGERSVLRIYRIDLDQLAVGAELTPDIIQFSYEDWDESLPPDEKEDFDCEAVVFFGDSLHLFTKGWNSFQTRHYVLPATPGTHTALLRQSFDCDGQITDAAIDPAGALVLLGYNVQTATSFLWLCYDTPMQLPPTGNPFSKNRRRIELGSVLTSGQTEALAFVRPGSGIIGSEQFGPLPARLLRLPTVQWWPLPTPASEPAAEVPLQIRPLANGLEFTWNGARPLHMRLFDVQGRTLASFRLSANETRQWQPNNIPSGVYFYVGYHDKEGRAVSGRLFFVRQ